MTLNDLTATISETQWFGHLTKLDVDHIFVRMPSLASWGKGGSGNATIDRIADQMDWLPSSRDQDDPFHGHSLEERADKIGKKGEFSQVSLGLYKATLEALRKFEGHPALMIGPHDFTEAARGAALFAVRRAAYEILLGEPSIWCRLMEVYRSGHWPCGVLPNQQIVVL